MCGNNIKFTYKKSKIPLTNLFYFSIFIPDYDFEQQNIVL